ADECRELPRHHRDVAPAHALEEREEIDVAALDAGFRLHVLVRGDEHHAFALENGAKELGVVGVAEAVNLLARGDGQPAVLEHRHDYSPPRAVAGPVAVVVLRDGMDAGGASSMSSCV